MFVPFVLVAALLTADPPIVIDGRFDDWADAAPAVVDPADAADSPVDFGAVTCRSDGQFVHLMIELGREVNIQHLNGRGLIVLDADGNERTGLTQFGLPGADVIVELTPMNPRDPTHPGMGIGLRSTTYDPDPAAPDSSAISPYDAGLTFGPTYASNRTEIRIQRGAKLPNTAPLFEGDQFRGRLIVLDTSQQIRDQTESFSCALEPLVASRQIVQERDPLLQPSGAALRVMNWNSEFGAIFKQPEVYGRILKVIEPFVIHFEEMPGERTVPELEELLNRIAVPPGAEATTRWHVLMGEGGGDLRCAIASRFDLKPVETVRLVTYPDRPDRAVRVAGGAIEVASKKILLVAVHLKCCGFAGSTEDQLRIREVELLHDAIAKAAATEHFDGVIISGDFNLVGSRTPLDRLAAPLAEGQSLFSIVDAYQLDGRSNATWSDRDQPFVPGRLDYMLCSPSLRVMRSFVFDSDDLATNWLTQYQLEAGDTAAASDHLPVVADFAFDSPK